MADILITGVNGQLGGAVEQEAVARGLMVNGSDVDTLDITDAAAVDRWVGTHRPRALINCAAYTAVDDCEAHEEEAALINGAAVAHLAASCNRVDATLVHVSTDYVFDGTGNRPYNEHEATRPSSAYGRTKLIGEVEARGANRHLVVRTAWLYGRGGKNFVEAIRRQVEANAPELRVVADQRGCPTSCDDLAAALLDLVGADYSGIVHAVNSGETTWHGFACEIVRLLGSTIPVHPVSTDAFPRPAPRPAYSVLDTTLLEHLIERPMPTWEHALACYLAAPCAG